MTIEFQAWAKTPRLNRPMVITEKIDGTNAAIHFQPKPDDVPENEAFCALDREEWFVCAAQSRKRLITPKDDNYGFARWVDENVYELYDALGPGTHYGEWWGNGIQRGYGLKNGDKRFSLFNVNRYAGLSVPSVPALGLVPTLYTGMFTTPSVNQALVDLRDLGSSAAPGFMKPEGIIVYHTAAQSVFKVTIEGDEAPKSLVK